MAAIKSLLLGFAITLFLMAAVSKAETVEENTNAHPEETTEPFTLENKKSSETIALSPFVSAVESDTFDQFILELGIERSDRAASYFLFKAEDALNQGRGAEAIRLGELAKKVSPFSPLPYFFLADAYWQLNPFSPLSPILHDLRGVILTLQDFSLLFTLISPYLFFFLLSIILTLVTFMLYSLVSYTSIWIHEISESSNGILHPIAATFLFFLILLTPLLLGLPMLWFFLFTFIIFWRFYSRGEKGIIFTFLLGLGSAAWLLPMIVTLFTVKGSFQFDEISRNARAEYPWVSPIANTDNPSWEDAFIQASFNMTRGEYQDAEKAYKTALEQNPNSPKILNNLGNIAFYLKDYNKAIDYYQGAISAAPELMSAHYNLSQTYREMLLFGEGEAAYAKAKKISEKTVEVYSMKSARFSKYPVIEERLSSANLIKLIFAENKETVHLSEQLWQSWVGEIPLSLSPLIALLFVILLGVSSYCLGLIFTAKPCSFCKRAVCIKCVKRLFSYQVCDRCQMEYKFIQTKADFKIIEDAVRKVPSKLYPFFLLPGGGHLATRNTTLAFFFLVPFYLIVASVFESGVVIPPTEWYLHRSGSFIQLILLVALFFFAGYHLFQMRKRRIWL